MATRPAAPPLGLGPDFAATALLLAPPAAGGEGESDLESVTSGPFCLADAAAYGPWRAARLAAHPRQASDITVEIGDPGGLTATERSAVGKRVAAFNAVLFRLRPPGDEATAKADLLALGLSLGLENPDRNPYADDDAITALAVAKDDAQQAGGRRLYIPYTNRALNWHTDGYYNPPARRIRAMGLYCVRAAESGGQSSLFDPEMAYLRMRDANPAWVRALAHPRAMTIPANAAADTVSREAVTGPVFSVNRADGTLHMRYTARKRHVIWRDDAATRAAAEFLQELLAADGPQVIRHRLAPGEGILCNNILHARNPFSDGQDQSGGHDAGRLLLRARYHSRIDVHGEAEPKNK